MQKTYPASDKEHSQEDLYELIDRLEVSVEQARGVPFTDSCIMDREELMILIGMIRENLPAEIKQAKWLLDQNRQIISEARKEAESIMRDAEIRMNAMVDEHEITRMAKQHAAQTVENANLSAAQIRKKSLDYARKKITELEDQLTEMLVLLQKNKKELK